MKKLVIAILVIGIPIGAYFYIREYGQVNLSVLEGEKTQAYLGDLVVPITASGHIRPDSITQIKSEASGEIVDIPFDVGMMVDRGGLLVRLDESDEQRRVDQAKADEAKAKVNLQRAEITLEERRKVGTLLAEAKLKQAQARLERAKEDHTYYKRNWQEGAGTQREYVLARTALEEAEAALTLAQAEQNQAQIAIDLAKQDVAVAKESLKTASKAREDAEERLSETKIFSPIEGMVLDRLVQVGEMVQSGTTSLTGGSVLVTVADVSDIYAVVNVDEADIGMVRDLAPPTAVPGSAATQPGLVAMKAADGAGAPTTQYATLPEEVLGTGQEVEVTVESFPNETFYGVIERISPQSEISQAIATFKVWIRITSDNRDELIGLLNTQAEAHFTAKSVTDAVLVSYDAFHRNPDGDGFGVYVPKGEDDRDYEFRECKFGVDNGIDVQVIEGLDAGEWVFTKLPKKTEREKEEAAAAEEE
jgi:HlyD family secretion protein